MSRDFSDTEVLMRAVIEIIEVLHAHEPSGCEAQIKELDRIHGMLIERYRVSRGMVTDED